MKTLRRLRDQALAACDFRVLPDAPGDTSAWIAYRQALRDLPAAVGPGASITDDIWPTPPAD